MALDRLFSLAYDDLQRIARRQLGHERRYHPYGTGDLVHEGYLRLLGQSLAECDDRGRFLAIAARAMRRILLDHARRAHAAKRHAEWTTLDETTPNPVDAREAELAALDEALGRLAEFDARIGRGVAFRFFGGYSEDETAAALGVTARTVRRDWVRAKEWLHHAMGD